MARAIIRPGIMVNLSVRVDGGVEYDREELAVNHDGATEKRTIRTDITVADADEHTRAGELRSRARRTVARVCTATPFGLICDPDKENELNAAIAATRAEIDAFNAASRYSQITMYCMTGTVSATAAENARAVGQQIADMLGALNAAVDKLDADAIRRAADKAGKFAAMLEAEQQVIVSDAIAQARKAARDITRRIVKKGEDAALVAMYIQRGALERARLTFLDLGDDAPAPAAGEGTPIAQPAALDLGDEEEHAVQGCEEPTPDSGEVVAASAEE